VLARVWIVLLLSAVGLLISTPARADGKCEQRDRSTGECQAPGGDSTGGQTGGGSSDHDPRRSAKCIDTIFSDPARSLPCSSDLGQWSNSEQCYLKIFDGESENPRDFRKFHCFSPHYAGAIDTQVVTIIFNGQMADPEAIARELVASLQLHAIHIGLAPHAGSTGLVQLPVWMWAADPDGRTWGPASASKTEQGLTVVVTASVKTVDWDMGDGTIVTCGVGTARPTGGGTNASPDCGHTYTTTSAGKPGGAFNVTATSHWTINWAAGAQQGTFPFELSDTAPLTIIESRAVLTAP